MAKERFVVSPCTDAGKDSGKTKGGSGEYDGMKGYQGRTKSSAGVPEKFMETLPESSAIGDYDKKDNTK